MKEISILLVEDNDDDRFLTMRLIRKLSFPLRIETSRNGEEAIKRILGENADPLPSLVLLDLQLPKISGISLLSSIREKYSQSELPVIVLSSSDNPRDLKLCNEMGISGYLSKPLDPSELLGHLDALTRPLHFSPDSSAGPHPFP
ncbi:MAG TPA: response regulator [Geobacteraceae bacterium]|nr:response regulator [Geobacteraceae bacterium]